MSQMIQFLDNSAMGDCKTAVAPIVTQYNATHIAGEGATPVVLPPVAAGDPLFYGGQIVLQGCFDAEVTITYYEGDDCDPCTTPDTLTPVDIVVIVPANSSFPLPDGFWGAITYVLVDAAGTPVDLAGTATETVRLYSCYTPACPNCAVLAP